MRCYSYWYALLLFTVAICKRTDTTDIQIAPREASRNSDEASRHFDDMAVPTAKPEITDVHPSVVQWTPRSPSCKSSSKPRDDSNNNKASMDRLNDQILRLTNDLSYTVATLASAEHREHKMAVLEREKCDEYVNAAADKMHKLVDNLQHADTGLASSKCRERAVQQQTARTTRLLNRSGRRLQVIRRLLTGAESGLVHMETNQKLHITHK